MKFNKELISVIVPVYNVESYVERCIRSLLDQTQKNIEIILVDDGSTDNSGILCDRFADENNIIKVIHKKNGGLSDARNVGISIAKGKYLVFVDSDDIVDAHLIEYLYKMVCSKRAQIGICNLLHCYPNIEIKFTKENKRILFNSENAIEEMLYQKSFLVAACGKIFLRSLFDDLLFPVGILFEDSAIMYKLFDKAHRIVYGDAKLYGYMHREESITTKKFSFRNFDILDIDDEIVKYFSKRGERLIKAARSYQTVGAMRVYLNAPYCNEYKNKIDYSKKLISINGKKVLLDKKSRLKTRIGVFLILYMPWAVKFIYSKTNRWK